MSSVEVAQRFFEEFPAYSEYKDSGIDWLGEIPKHWEVKKLKYVAPISDKKLDKKPDDVTYLGLENIESKTSRLLLDNPIEEVESAVNYFQKGNILFGKLRPYLAKVAYPDFSGVCTTELLVLNPNHNLFGKYLSYQMLADGFIDLVNSMTYGTKMPRANAEQIQNIEISFPSFSEQKQIATFLDRATTEIDHIIEQQTQLITLLEEERTTIISHTVTKGLDPSVPMKDSGIEWLGEIPKHWKFKRLKYFAKELISGPFGSSITKDMYTAKGYRVYGQEQVIPRDFSIGDYYISEAKFQEMQRYKVVAGDILISCVGTFGKIAVVPPNIEAGIINPRLIKLTPDINSVSPEYLELLLRSPVAFTQMENVSRGGTMDIVNISLLSGIALPLPPKEEQKAIALFLDQETARIDEAIDNVRSQIEKLEEYRTVLISDAVTGKIDVRGFS